mmetsp:Transcript_39042/g.63013  ORF Transcript_39042/g.63013 Transcript_39042/m.63013 type:complete len:6535 (+) Transcript_39042:430-20034(+)
MEGLRTNLKLLQSIVQSPLPAFLDDVQLGKFDPCFRSQTLKDASTNQADEGGQNKENECGGGDQEDSVGNTLRSRQNALSEILLAYDIGNGPANTIVNDMTELQLSVASPISAGNVARLLLTNALHASLQALHDQCANLRWSSSVNKSAVEGQHDTDTKNLVDLILAAYPQRCSKEPDFVHRIVADAKSEGREEEFANALKSQISKRHVLLAGEVSQGTSMESSIPASAFMSMALIEMQINSLDYAFSFSSAESSNKLLSSTCSGLMTLFELMPLGGLCDLADWEHNTLDKISEKLVSLGKKADREEGFQNSDTVNLLLLGLAIQRGSLTAVLSSLIRALEGNSHEPITLDLVLKSLFQRLSKVELYCPFGADGALTEATSPVSEVHVRWTNFGQTAKQDDNTNKNADGERKDTDGGMRLPVSNGRLPKPVAARNENGEQRRLQTGDLVMLADPTEVNPALEGTEVGRIFYDDGGLMPFRVCGPKGPSDYWFRESSLVLVSEDDLMEASDLLRTTRPSNKAKGKDESLNNKAKIQLVDAALKYTPKSCDSIGISEDGRYIYICGESVGGIVKVGSGCNSLGSSPTVEGHVYASTQLSTNRYRLPHSSRNTTGRASNSRCCFAWIAVIGGRLLLLTRKAGSLNISVEAYDAKSLQKVKNPTNNQPGKYRLMMANQIISEQFVAVQGENNVVIKPCSTLDNSVRVELVGNPTTAASVAWCGNGSAWLNSSGIYYYEVKILTMGRISIGWATPAFFNKTNKEADDHAAWTFNVYNATTTDENGVIKSWGQICKPGDVIGCILNIDSANLQVEIAFSRNGAWGAPMGTAIKLDSPVLFARPVVVLNPNSSMHNDVVPKEGTRNGGDVSPSSMGGQSRDGSTVSEGGLAAPASSMEIASATPDPASTPLEEHSVQEPCVEIFCGGIKEHNSEVPMGRCTFHHHPPSGIKVSPVAWNSGNCSADDEELEDEVDEFEEHNDDDDCETLGSLPPFSTDGRYIYCVQRVPMLLPQFDSFTKEDESNEELAIDILDPLDNLNVVKRIRAVVNCKNFPSLQSIMEWRTFTNGDDVVVVEDRQVMYSPDPSAPPAHKKTRQLGVIRLVGEDAPRTSESFWRRVDGWPGSFNKDQVYALVPKKELLSLNDAFAFSRTHNVVWSWCAIHNTCKMFENELYPSFVRQPIDNGTFESSNTVSRVELCVLTLESIANLTLPFFPSNPIFGIFYDTLQTLSNADGGGSSRILTSLQNSSSASGVFVDTKPGAFRMVLKLLTLLRNCKDSEEVSMGVLNRGMVACVHLLVVNCASYIASVRSGSCESGLQIPNEDVRGLLEICTQIIMDTDGQESLKALCVSMILHCIEFFFADLKDRIQFVVRHLSEQIKLSSIASDHNALLLSGLLQSIAAELLTRSFVEQMEIVHDLLPLLFQVVETQTFEQVRKLEKDSWNEGNATSNPFIFLCDSACSVIVSLLTSGFCFVTNDSSNPAFDQVVDIFTLLADKCSKILQVSCDVSLHIFNNKAKLGNIPAREAALGEIVQNSLVGRVFPTACAWIEFLLRSKKEKSRSTFVLLSSDLSLAHITAFLGHVVTFCSAITTGGASLAKVPISQQKDVAKPPTSRTKSLRRRSSTIVTAAAVAAQQAKKDGKRKPVEFSWSRVYAVEKEYESTHSYDNDLTERTTVEIPGANMIKITFDPRTATEDRRDFIRFLRIPPNRTPFDTFMGGHSEHAPEYLRFGEERYSGTSGWPGVGDEPDLVIPSNRFVFTFTTDGSDVDWGYRFVATAEVSDVKHISCNPWFVHLASICRDFVSAVVHATVGSCGSLQDEELRQLRWIQNPILSGGLKSGTVQSHPNSTKKKRARTMSGSNLRTHSMSEEDKQTSEEMLLEMLNEDPPNLGGALFKFLREQRVPLDQGYYTHRAASSLGAALIRANGLEREALRIAKSRLAGQPTDPPSPKLLKVWSIAQYIRSWADQLVINGQVLHHVEASLPQGSSLQIQLLKLLQTMGKYDDPDEPQYRALCEIVSTRARFLILDACPPVSRMVSLGSARQDAARARWHRLRRHFCPKTQQMIQQQKRWDVVLGGLRALSSLRSMVDLHRSAAQKMTIPLNRSRTGTLTRQRSSDLPPIVITPTSSFGTKGRDRANTSSDDSYDGNAYRSLTPGVRLVRTGSSHQYGMDSPMHTPPHLLSTKSSSSTSSASSVSSASHFSFQGPFRRRERMSGGLRRVSGVAVDSDVDIVAQEHDQSLSESVTTFLKAAVPLDASSLRLALEGRNERAVMRVAGFEFINTLIGLSRSHQRHTEGRLLFEKLLHSTARALRGMDNSHNLSASTGMRVSQLVFSDAPHAVAAISSIAASVVGSTANLFEGKTENNSAREDMRESESESSGGMRTGALVESHYLTDLPGCSINLRESVSRKFLSFLQSVSMLLLLTIRQRDSVTKALRGERKIVDKLEETEWHKQNLCVLSDQLVAQIKELLLVVALDFVESDFELLSSGGIVQAIRSVLFHEFGNTRQQPDVAWETIHGMAWKCFELLLRRCVCEAGDTGFKSKRFTSGNILQQSLLDVLVSLVEHSLQKTTSPLLVFNAEKHREIDPIDNSISIIQHLEGIGFAAQPFGLVGDSRTLHRNCSIEFSITARESGFKSGRLFSIGNPQVKTDAIGLSTSEYIPSPPQKKDQVRFAWLEVSIDGRRRLVVSVGDLAGVSVTVVSDYALPLDVECRVSVFIREVCSLELHILSVFPPEELSGEQRVYTVEVFADVLFQVGQLPIDIRDGNTTDSKLVQVGDYVRIVQGVFVGLTGCVLAQKNKTSCVCLNLDNFSRSLADSPFERNRFTIVVENSALLLVPRGARSVQTTLSASVMKLLLEDPENTEEKQIVSVMSNLCFDDTEISNALQRFGQDLHRSTAPAGLVDDNDMKSSNRFPGVKYSIRGPIYLGLCPEWGMGKLRNFVQGLTLHELLLHPSTLTCPRGFEGIHVSRDTIDSTFATVPTQVNGGVIYRFPFPELLGQDDVDGDEDEDGSLSSIGSAIPQLASGLLDDVLGEICTQVESEQQTINALQVLSLTYAACSSPVGRARLTAPFPMALLLKTCVTGSVVLELRVASAHVLGVLLLDVSPSSASTCARTVMEDLGIPVPTDVNNAMIHLITHNIGQALYLLYEKPSHSVVRLDSNEATVMAMQLVELLHTLCAQELWALTISRWVAYSLGRLGDKFGSFASSSEEERVTIIQNGVAALAVLGGVYVHPRVGGRAFAASKGGLLSKNEVVILGKVPQVHATEPSKEQRAPSSNKHSSCMDITSKMKLQVSSGHVAGPVGNLYSLLDSSNLYWESNGYTPHWIQLTCPQGFTFHTISIFTNEAFDNYSPENVVVRVGSELESLRTVRKIKLQRVTKWIELATENDMKPSDKVFRLEINSNHSGGCDSRVQQFKIIGRRFTEENMSKFGIVGDQFYIRPVYGGNEDDTMRAENANVNSGTSSGSVNMPGADNGADASKVSGITIEDGSALEPVPLTPPQSLVECLHQDVVKSLQLILKKKGQKKDLVHADVRARAIKVVCVLLESQVLMETIGDALLPHLLHESKWKQSANELSEMPINWSLTDAVAQRLRISTSSQDSLPESIDDSNGETSSLVEGGSIITFNAAGKLHRAVALDTPPMISGKHTWECKLLEDTRDDETSLFGITTLARLGSGFVGPHADNILKPSSDFWLLQSFNGNRIHKGIPPQWDGGQGLKIHPGDTVRFLLDMDCGTLCIGVNEEPMVRVFFGIDKEAMWGVYPCVASYGNHSKVRIHVEKLAMSQSDADVLVPQRHLLLSGWDSSVEARAAKLCSLLYEGLGDDDSLSRTPPSGYKRTSTGGSSSSALDMDDHDDEDESLLEYDTVSSFSGDESDNETEQALSNKNDECDSRGDRRKRKPRVRVNGVHTSGKGRVSTNAQHSQQMIQKINALYELAESSVEQDTTKSPELLTSNVQRYQDIHLIAMAILSDPRFVTNSDWLINTSMDIFDEMYSRLSARALEQLVVDWSACTTRPLPSFLLDPSVLGKTINLIFKSCRGDYLAVRSVEAACFMCRKDSDMSLTLLDWCVNTFAFVGQKLSVAVQDNKRRYKLRLMEREQEEKDSATAAAQAAAATANTNSSGRARSDSSQASEKVSSHRPPTSRAPQVTPSSIRAEIKVGDQVRARYMGGRNWYKGVISHVYPDGTYGIAYDDGDKESHVLKQMIELSSGDDEHATSSPSGARSPSSATFARGERIQARFSRDFKFFDGRIARCHDQNTYDIMYDDGDFERRVPARFIRRHPRESSVPPPPPPPPPPPTSSATPPDLEDIPAPPRRSGNETYLLIADRYRGDIPPSGKPDSAQVSIINSPCTADGLVKSVKLRLAEPPAGGMSSWDVLVFERAGDTSTFFVVAGTPSRPTRGTLHFDPQSTDIQTVLVQGNVYIAQGQYLGVINPKGRLNVAYTPGKKKIEESWALKPVEVFYLMPKNVPVPFVGGPHRTRLWHGRAGWCATMLVESSSSGTGRPRFLRQCAEDVFSSTMSSGLTVEESIRQACWLLRVLVREGFLTGMEVLSVRGFACAVRRICEHGIFCIDGDSSDLDETTSTLNESWLPMIEMITQVCSAVVQAGMDAPPKELGEPLARAQTESIIHLQGVLEGKVNDMNKQRQRRLREIAKSKSSIVPSGHTAATPQSGLGGNNQANTTTQPPSGTETDPSPAILEVANSTVANLIPSTLRGLSSSGSGNSVHPSTLDRSRGRDVEASATTDVSQTNGNQQNNVETDAKARPSVAALDEPDEQSSFTGVRFQRLLKCLVAVDDLTRKDGLDGEMFLVDSPRRSLDEEAEWEDFTVSISSQNLMSPPVIMYEYYNGRLCVSQIRQSPFDKSDAGEVKNVENLGSKLIVGDELIGVEGIFLDDLDPDFRNGLLMVGISGPRTCDEGNASSRSILPDEGIDLSLDLSKPYYYNGVLFPPLEINPSTRAAKKPVKARRSETMPFDIDALGNADQIELTFRRRQGEITFSQTLHSGKGISYRGVRGYVNCGSDSNDSEHSQLLDNAEWLDSLVTATELLKAFAWQSLPPERFLKEQFGTWCQRKRQGELQSSHPIFENTGDITKSPTAGSHVMPPPKKALSRQRTHSRSLSLGSADEDPVNELSLSDSLPTKTTSSNISHFDENKDYAQTVSIPGATALRLSWDPRSCLWKNRNNKSIVLTVGDQTIRGFRGLPPNVSVVCGSSLTVRVEHSSTESAHEKESMLFYDQSRDIAVAGLQNRAGAYIWLGTKVHFRGKFYCGRSWSDIVGWSASHGMCGPLGDRQCPDCAVFVPKNFKGLPMQCGVSRDASSKSKLKDLLYCEQCVSPPIPCESCRKFLAVMQRTACMTRIPYRKRAQFESNMEYATFLRSVIVTGMPLRITLPVKRFGIRAGTIGIVQTIGDDLTCTVGVGYVNRSSVQLPLHELELVTVREFGGVDFRSSIRAGLGKSGSSVVPSEEATDENDEGADASHVGERPATRFLEATDFATMNEYGQYMVRNCHVHDKVRCSKRYESVDEGDVGEVIRVDDGDDLPCQVAWENLGAQYWLPWNHLSLNLSKPDVVPDVDESDSRADSGRQHDRASDDASVTFSPQVVGLGIELYNNNRSVTRSSRQGWGTQRLNRYVDCTVRKMNVFFRIDANSSSRLFLGVVSETFGQGSTRDSDCPLSEIGAWALKRDGSLHVDGVEVRGKTSSKSFKAGEIITVSVDISSSSVTFLRGKHVIDTIAGIPGRVVPAVSLSSSYQRVSIKKVEIGNFAVLYPIDGWGYRIVVQPAFDATRLCGIDNDECAGEEEEGVDSDYRAYLKRQTSWARKQDELLVSYVNEAIEGSGVELEQLLQMNWDDLISIYPIHVSGQSSEEVGATAASSQLMSPNSEDAELVSSSGPIEGLHVETNILDGVKIRDSPCLKALIKGRASELELLIDSSGSPMVVIGDGLVRQAVLELVLDDIAQRYDLIRALNQSVHDALGLLDLGAWKDPSSSAACLSECCGLIFDKFKVPLWADAIASTKAEDIHKFEVVLDFGRAMSRRHITDVHGRHTVFAQAFRVMHPMAPKTLRAHGKLYKCVMRGMASHDDGGPYRQSFSQYCTELQTLPGVGLLLPCSNRANQIRVNRDRWLPNPAAVSPVQISMFEFLGKLMGIAIRNHELLDLRLPSLVWKPLVNQVPTIDDLRAVDVLTVSNTDPECTNPSNLLESQDIFFTVITLDGREVELLPNGRMVAVTSDNYQDWARRVLDFKIHEFDIQSEAIRRGLSTIVPQRLLMLFRWDELELMVCGRPRLDLALLKRMTVYSDCSESDPHIQYFWQVLESFSEEQRSEYIKFVWGRARLPLDKESWEQHHKIAAFHPPRPTFGKPPTKTDSLLPYAHTCYFTIDLPRYSSADIMRRRLLYAIENCPEIDGDQTTAGRRAAAMGFDIGESDEDDDDVSDDAYEDVNLPPSPPPLINLAGDFTNLVNRQLRLDTIAENIAGGRQRRLRLDMLLGERQGTPLAQPSPNSHRPFSFQSVLSRGPMLEDDPFGEFVDAYGDGTGSDQSSD